MVFKRAATIGLAILAPFFLGSAQADDLIQVYNQALHNDPTFKQAQSTWWSAKQNLPIAVSSYLPQVSLTDTYERVYAKTKPQAAANVGMGWHNSNVLTLTATQAIFDYSVWTNIRAQAAAVKAATATYLSAIQDLMARTEKAYFSVLDAYDKLSLTIAQKKAVKRQLVTAQQKFKVGLIAITGVYDAQSSYDTANANEISDRNALYNALENLRAITGQHYLTLQGIPIQVPLITPQPNNINTWVRTAQAHNYGLQSANFSAIQAHENILNQVSGYMPSLDATASYADTQNTNYQKPGSGATAANKKTVAADYGLSLAWNPFSGGATYYGVKQARADYLTALGSLETTHRDVINQTRQSFLGVISGISRIRADKQAIISTRNALKATEAGYLVGTRTMVNILDELTKVNQAEFNYRDHQYDYLTSLITLKEEAGTLTIQDLEKINGWLKKRIAFPLPQNYYAHDQQLQETPVMTKLRRLDAIPHMPKLHAVSHQKVAVVKNTKAAPHLKKAMPKKQAVMTSHNSTSYAVQFYAANNKRSAMRFITHSKLKDHLRVVKLNRHYKVLYGQFKSREAALIALDALPINHASSGTWVLKIPMKKSQLPVPGSR